MRRKRNLRVLLLLMSSSACAPPESDTLEQVRSRGELIWAGDLQGGEPYVYEDPAVPGRVVGFEVDIMEGVARKLGVASRFHHCAWSYLVPSLERGDFDVIANGLEATAEREATILLSQPYLVYAETLAIRRGGAERSLDALAGKRIGTLNQTYARALLNGRPLEPVLYESGPEPYLDLAAGRIDAVLLDNIIADRFGCNQAEIECVPGDVARGTYVMGLRRSDARLKTAIDLALDDMIRSGELQRILEKWHLWDERQTDADARQIDRSQSGGGFNSEHVVLFLEGTVVTVYLAVAAFLLAMILGVLIAVARIFGLSVGRFVSAAYVEIFRGTPLLLQLYLLYFGLAPLWKFGAMTAAILGLGLNYAAYESEVYRGAIQSLPRGQSEAAHALGLSNWETLRHVLLPQAFRFALPAMTNDFVALLKDTSIVSVIAVVELTKRATITAVDVHGWLVPGIACASLYFGISFPLARLSRALEGRLHRDSHPRPA